LMMMMVERSTLPSSPKETTKTTPYITHNAP